MNSLCHNVSSKERKREREREREGESEEEREEEREDEREEERGGGKVEKMQNGNTRDDEHKDGK